MRVYQNLAEAFSEIQRDLAKSPKVTSSRVQNRQHEGVASEAMNYSYTVRDIPDSPEVLVGLGVSFGLWKESEARTLVRWLKREVVLRLDWKPGETADLIHPALSQVIEGEESSYLYTDRLRGGLQTLAGVLQNARYSRRAYLPIFIPEDAVRASRMTRVPCSLGYFAAIRDVNDEPRLHMTYLMRSCDFGTFWLSDLWFASQYQKTLVNYLNSMDEYEAEVQVGSLSHIVLSLHSFVEGEIY